MWMTLALWSGLQASGAPIQLVGLDGSSTALELAELNLKDPRERQAWRVRFPESSAVDVPRQAAEVQLWGGERLYGEVRGGKGEDLVFATSCGIGLVLALEELDQLRFPARIPELWTQNLEPASEGDRIYRRSREALDTLNGGTEGFAAAGIAFDISGIGKKTVPWNEIAAWYIDRESGKDRPATKWQGVPVELDLVDGGRLRGGLEQLSAAGCVLVRAHGERLEIPLRTLFELVVRDGRVAFLSELPAQLAPPCSPFGDELGMLWETRMDRSVSGTRLSVGSKIHARGIGMHAPNRALWKLSGGWKTLQGSVGIDDSTRELSARGSVVFRLLCDGQVRYQSPVVRGGDALLALPSVALEGVQELELVVDDAGDGFAGDRANWLDLTLTR